MEQQAAGNELRTTTTLQEARRPAAICTHTNAEGTRWGDPVTEARANQLLGWLRPSAGKPIQESSQKPFARQRLTGADVFWLAIRALAGSEGDIAAAEATLRAINQTTATSPSVDLSALHLEEADLRGAHLEGAALSGAHLEGIDLRGAYLEGADLRETKLEGGWLRAAHLEKATLREAYLRAADLVGAYLDGANLVRAHLEGATLREAQLKRASLSEAHLERTRLGRVVLEEADLFGAHLERADLWRAHLVGADLRNAQLAEAVLHDAHIERAILGGANLGAADLRGAHLEGADLRETRLGHAILPGAHLEGADLTGAHLEGADLREAFFSTATTLRDARLYTREEGSVKVADTRWGGVNLANISKTLAPPIGDEQVARAWMPVPLATEPSKPKPRLADRRKHHQRQRSERLRLYQAAVRANRQLSVALQDQGMNEDAARFAFQAQICQRHVLRFEGPRTWGAWLFSHFLDKLAGYGYRPQRSVGWYVIVIITFATAYYVVTHGQLALGVTSAVAPLHWYEALVLSISSFHGRGFFQPLNSLGDPVAILAAIEAIVGLLIEVSFIATFTQRFLGGK